MKTKIVIVLFLVTTLLLVTMPAKAQTNEQECECVKFFLNKFNNGNPVTGEGTGDSAESMANDIYWQKTDIPRKRSQTAQMDDIIIMQSEAVVYAWNISNKSWDMLNGNIGLGYGHIGLVLSANYHDKYLINNQEISGWLIVMQSANWDDDFYYDNGSLWSSNGTWTTLNNCTNVNNSWIFVPNGDVVSFWRAIPSSSW